MLSRMCFKYHRTDGMIYELLFAHEYNFIPVDTIRRSVQAVRRRTVLVLIERGKKQPVSYFMDLDGTETYDDEIIYINWIFTNGIKKFVFVESGDSLTNETQFFNQPIVIAALIEPYDFSTDCGYDCQTKTWWFLIWNKIGGS